MFQAPNHVAQRALSKSEHFCHNFAAVFSLVQVSLSVIARLGSQLAAGH